MLTIARLLGHRSPGNHAQVHPPCRQDGDGRRRDRRRRSGRRLTHARQGTHTVHRPRHRPPPTLATREYAVWDSQLSPASASGFGPPAGGAMSCWRTRAGRTRRVSLGPVSLKSVAEARRECHARKASPEPQATWHAQAGGSAVPGFRRGRVEGSPFRRIQAVHQEGRADPLLDRQLLPAFGSKPLDRIAPTHIGRWFDRFSRTAPGNANHALDLLTQIINFAIARGHLDTNPARAVERNPRRVLTRFLSREEISLGSIGCWTGRPATAVESRRISSGSCS